jgi:hypothetical protein
VISHTVSRSENVNEIYLISPKRNRRHAVEGHSKIVTSSMASIQMRNFSHATSIGYLIVRVKVVVCVKVPFLPVTVTVYVPRVALELTVIFKVDLPVVVLTGFGVKL